MGGILQLLAAAQLRVRADGVEVAKRRDSHVTGPGEILKDQFHHELGARIGGAGLQRRVLSDDEVLVGGVDGGRRAEQEPLDAVALQGGQQGDGLGDVVLVVGQRLGNGFRHDDLRGAVHDGIDLLLPEEPVQQGVVGDVALIEGALADEFAAPGGEIVEDDDVVARVLTGRGDGAADVSGPAGDEYLHVAVSWFG